MGAYLNKPVLTKDIEDGETDCISYAVSSMQGWRISQEVILFRIYLFESQNFNALSYLIKFCFKF